MKRSNNWRHGPLWVAPALLTTALSLSGCEQRAESQPLGVAPQAQLDEAVEGIAKACGLDINCEAGGLLMGRASISGVASVDAFFGSVINFQAKADIVSGAIEAELGAIRADFGIEADADFAASLRAQVEANVDGELAIVAEPARCSVDVEATLEAQARCDADFDPGSVMVACEGTCEVEASAEVSCEGSAELNCTFIPPSGQCEGSCSGTCESDLSVAGACEGVCKGQCDGTLMADTSSGASGGGRCDGNCMGTCEVEVTGGVECSGSCQGECTIIAPSGGCEGAIRAECKAEAGAMVMCDGRCEGNFEPPEAKVECQASAKAEARMNVECTPPRVAINYRLDASVSAEAELEAQARFRAAVDNLKVRLPRLLAAVKRAEVLGEAGASLIADAGVAVEGGVNAAITADPNVKDLIGLTCALGELKNVGQVVNEAGGKIEASLSAAGDLSGALL